MTSLSTLRLACLRNKTIEKEQPKERDFFYMEEKIFIIFNKKIQLKVWNGNGSNCPMKEIGVMSTKA